jgi:hypothetical protein
MICYETSDRNSKEGESDARIEKPEMGSFMGLTTGLPEGLP